MSKEVVAPTTPSNDDAARGGDAIPPVRVHGDLADRMTVVSRAGGSLLIGLGRVDEREVLVPYIELALHQPDEDDEGDPVFDPPIPFLKTVAYENLAFVITRLASDFEDALMQLRAISFGRIKPEPERVRLTHAYIAEARDRLDGCLREIEGMVEEE